MASTRVVLPWSTWATIATLRRSERTGMGYSSRGEGWERAPNSRAHRPILLHLAATARQPRPRPQIRRPMVRASCSACLLYTSDAADDLLCVDLGGRRI